jgi:hypothetical protein
MPDVSATVSAFWSNWFCDADAPPADGSSSVVLAPAVAARLGLDVSVAPERDVRRLTDRDSTLFAEARSGASEQDLARVRTAVRVSGRQPAVDRACPGLRPDVVRDLAGDLARFGRLGVTGAQPRRTRHGMPGLLEWMDE